MWLCSAVTLAPGLFHGGSAAAIGVSCLPVSSRSSSSEVEAFKREPERYIVYLGGNPKKLEDFVSILIASDPDLLDPLRHLIARANREERRSIGIGLANAADRCARSQPAASSDIFKYVVKLSDTSVNEGFLSRHPAPRATLQPPSSSKLPQGQLLLEGEHGDKLVDPFAELPLSR